MPLHEIDPYSILGIPADSTAEEIKSAYRRAARRLHPDTNHSPGAAAQFQDITSAYELLNDSARRHTYDSKPYKENPEDFTFALRVTPSKRTVMLLPEAQVIYLLAEITPDARVRSSLGTDTQTKRVARVNLTLVLDHSNSMKGARLEKVKIAAHQIIDNLTADDILSVISFNDRAEVIIPATPVQNKAALKARISMMAAAGGTEIFKGLQAGIEQNRKYRAPKLVNHVIMLTDGNTFGDQDPSIVLARSAAEEGIGISAMGLGQEWNDEFLDELASVTGGTCSYIESAGAVVRFLNEKVRNLSDAFAERMRVSVAPDPDVKLESAFKLTPHPQPLTIEEGFIQLGSLQPNRPISVLFQFQMPANMALGFRTIARMMVEGDILENPHQFFRVFSDISLEIATDPPPEDPPLVILDALGKLTLYRMQERAQDALERGDIREATRRLENLATRLLALGEENLAHQALAEARRVAHTSALSDEGKKALKYQTRTLMLGPSTEDN